VLSSLRWLALEVKAPAAARSFYEGPLGRRPADERDGEVRYEVGPHELRLRRPDAVPRGGLHTHYALSTPTDRYDDWYDRLAPEFDLVEHSFGEARSLYCYDPDGNCVEVAGTGAGGPEADGAGSRDDGPPLTGVFEVVLEVADLDRSLAFYRALGFEVVDRGADRRRVRP